MANRIKHRRHLRDRLHGWSKKDLAKLTPEHKRWLTNFDRQAIGGEFKESERADWVDDWSDPEKRAEVNQANYAAKNDILSIARRSQGGGKAPDGRVIRADSLEQFDAWKKADGEGDDDGTLRDTIEMMAQGYTSPTDYEDAFLEALDRKRNRSDSDDEE